MIIESSDNRLYRVEETGDADLAHVWFGIEVKKSHGAYVPKAKSRRTLVRKDATKVIAASGYVFAAA